MPYILPDSFLTQIETLATDYEEVANVKLKQASPNRFSLWLGAKDTSTRSIQIKFIHEWLKLLRPNLNPDNNFANREAIIEHITALKRLVALCLFIKSELHGDSDLEKLIDHALGLNKENPLDEMTKEYCLQAAKELVTQHSDLQKLEHYYGVRFDFQLYQAFTTFLNEHAIANKEAESSFKVTTTLIPLFALSFELVGNSVGYVLGDALGHCIPLSSGQSAAAATLATTALYATGSSINPCLLLLGTPTIAKCINSVCGVSAAYAGGKLMGLIGIATACAIGGPIDLTANSLSYIYESLPSMHEQEPSYLNGYCLVHFSRVIGPVEFFLLGNGPSLALNPHCKKSHLAVEVTNEKLSMKLDDEPLELEEELKQEFLRNLTQARLSSLSAKKPMALSEQEGQASSYTMPHL